ncbi:hypothetical protein [Streptomyces sp. NBC_00645]|uniref:hypothetical protein n=1 Tax=Streptomyces sp. NBC_00645 TaxID=2975795 RepID=UPI003253581E
MVKNLVAVFSTLIGLAGLMLSYAGHRQKVRQEAQEAQEAQETARRAEELRRIERDREQEQEARALREEAREQRERAASARREWERLQASMIGGHIALSPSSLNDNWVVPQVVIHNGSNQPVRDVRVFFQGEVIHELPLVGTGHEYLPQPPAHTQEERYRRQVTVEFTDVAGIRWRRDGYGALQRARQGTEGQEIWEAPETPVIESALRPSDLTDAGHQMQHAPARMPETPPQGPPTGPLSGPSAPPAPSAPYGGGAPAGGGGAPARRHVGLLRLAVVLVSLALIAGGVWSLIHH